MPPFCAAVVVAVVFVVVVVVVVVLAVIVVVVGCAAAIAVVVVVYLCCSEVGDNFVVSSHLFLGRACFLVARVLFAVSDSHSVIMRDRRVCACCEIR